MSNSRYYYSNIALTLAAAAGFWMLQAPAVESQEGLAAAAELLGKAVSTVVLAAWLMDTRRALDKERDEHERTRQRYYDALREGRFYNSEEATRRRQENPP